MLTVGRTRASNVWIKDSAVSEKHAEISWIDQNWVLQDKGSTNGTMLNGAPIAPGSRHHPHCVSLAPSPSSTATTVLVSTSKVAHYCMVCYIT